MTDSSPNATDNRQSLPVETFVRLMALVAVLISFGWAMTSGAQACFYDGFSALLVVCGSMGVALFAFGPRGLWQAFRTLFRRVNDEEDARSSASFFRLASGFALGSGFLGLLIGMVKMLANMESPASLGSGMATALLSAFYGVGLAMILAAAAVIVLRSANGTSPDLSAHTRQSLVTGGAAVVTGTLTVIVCLAIVVISMGRWTV